MKKSNTVEFVQKAKKVHGDKYDYSLVNYEKSIKPVIIICSKHGEFKQKPNIHLNGSGCNLCKSSNQRTPIDVFIKKSQKVHGDKYDYSLVHYKNIFDTVKIICPLHGIFEQVANNHYKNGCSVCSSNKKSNKKDFIKRAKNIHGNKYDYSLVNYINSHTKVKIICPKHGIFTQKPTNHIQKDHKQGCPVCKESKGENQIRIFLGNNNIKYIRQKKFNNCKYKYSLSFDFYLPEHNMCIEFDGIQHRKSFDFFGGEKRLMIQNKRDKIKTDYCKEHGIKLIRIKYDESINDKLSNFQNSFT